MKQIKCPIANPDRTPTFRKRTRVKESLGKRLRKSNQKARGTSGEPGIKETKKGWVP